MATIVPSSEMAKRALSWILERKSEGGDVDKLIDEASMRFNLGPKDAEFLKRFFRDQENQG